MYVILLYSNFNAFILFLKFIAQEKPSFGKALKMATKILEMFNEKIDDTVNPTSDSDIKLLDILSNPNFLRQLISSANNLRKKLKTNLLSLRLMSVENKNKDPSTSQALHGKRNLYQQIFPLLHNKVEVNDVVSKNDFPTSTFALHGKKDAAVGDDLETVVFTSHEEKDEKKNDGRPATSFAFHG